MAESDFFEVIRRRRSVREYVAKEVEADKVEALVEAALRAPSSRGVNPWEFVLVRDKGTLLELSRCKPHGASFVKDASLAIVVCGDPNKSDVWVEDTSIACTFLLLAAEAMGLGACWVQIRGRMYDERTKAGDKVAEILCLPANLEVEAIVAVGYPAEVKRPHSSESLHWNKVHEERYGRGYSLMR